MPASRLISFDPWDNSLLWTGHKAKNLASISELAWKKFASDWSREPQFRRQVLLNLVEQLKHHRQEFADLISRETGKVLWESIMEIDAMIKKCSLCITAEDERRTASSRKVAGSLAGTLATTYRPHGVVAVIGPFNFPAHLPFCHIAPALLAGNTVIFKPSEKAPASGEFLVNLFIQAGLPDGVLQLAQGGPDTAVELLKTRLGAVFFTGSYASGRKIIHLMHERPDVLLALEMGGNNPLIVWDAADTRTAVLNIIQSAYITAGQRCSCARRLILADNDPVLPALIDAIPRIAIGRWDENPQPFFSTLIDSDAAERVLSAQDYLTGIGCKPLLPATRSERCNALLTPGLLDATAREFHDDNEIFGPLLQVTRVKTFDDALHAANNTSYGLCAGLLTDRPELWETFRLHARAGCLTLNRPTTSPSGELPFGGIGSSGNHRPSAYFAPDYCSYPVAEITTPTLAPPRKLPPGLKL